MPMLIPIIIYRSVQTIGNTKSGGVSGDFISVGYQLSSACFCMNAPKAPIANANSMGIKKARNFFITEIYFSPCK